tara:strand:- start:221 stop:463 length:243 start_codon:yes stop_codon:yes gene_type:complete
MKSKYIIVESLSGGDFPMPFVFSDVCKHSDIARAVGGVVIGAGFCFIEENQYQCYGESISCRVKSNGADDSKILNTMLQE